MTRRRIGSAFAILEQVARHCEGIGLAELSKLVGLHNSTTFHLAKTMVSLGYLRQEKDTKRYRVGRPLFALAASALDEIEIAEVRRSAIAIDDGEFNPEVRCVAVPVYNFTGDVVGALGISGPVWRMTD